MPKKFYMPILDIELTRKCNQSCKHCYHGTQQFLTISESTINTMFSQLFRVDIINIVGGETLLEIDRFEYLLKAIDRYNLNVEALGFFTNGSILDERLIPILNNFVNAKANRIVNVNISSDQFHDQAQAQKALGFYTKLNTNNHIAFKLAYEEGIKGLTYSGYAKNFIDVKYNSYQGLGDIHAVLSEASIRSHQLSIEGSKIKCILQLLANGNIIIQTMSDYRTSDGLSIGNVLKDSLENIVTHHNDRCPFLCDETYNERWLRETRFLHNNKTIESETLHLTNQLYLQRFELAWMSRLYVKRKFPSVPMQTIIALIPPLSKDELLDLCIKIIQYNSTLEESRNKYVSEYREMFPEASLEDLQELSSLKYYNKIICTMPFDKMVKHLKIGTIINKLGISLLCGILDNRKAINVCELTIDSITPEITKNDSV